MLPKASSSVHTMFEARLSLLAAVFNAFSCKQWEPTGSLPWGKATLRKNKQSSACTWWLQMFHVHYINYDSKIAHFLNKFFNKNSMLLQTLGNVCTPLLLSFQIYANLLQLVQAHSNDYKYDCTSLNYKFNLRLFIVMIYNESMLSYLSQSLMPVYQHKLTP